ncbi:MAG TPA: hypothetical protein PKL99_01740 [Syntrophales bacterium]|nr:hypothetical protein [Syntrophales bacterium]
MEKIKVSVTAFFSLFLVIGLTVVPAADGAPVVLSETGFFNTPGTSEAVAVSGNYAYVADGYLGLRIIDVSDPAAPSETGFYNTPGYSYDVAVSGNYAYVADGSKGLRIIDVTNRASPTERGYYVTPGSTSARGVVLSGSRAYVAFSNGGLQIINVGSPGSPYLEGSLETTELNSAYDVALSSLYAFVANQSKGLNMINISNPSSPIQIGNFNTSGQVNAVALYNKFACVADHSKGLRVIDVSNPSVPVETGFYDPAISKYYYDVAVLGYYAFIASDGSGSNGLRVIDLSDPASPEEAAYCDTTGDPRGVALHGKYAYLAASSSGLRIIDIAPLLTNYVYYVPYYSGFADYWTGLGIRNESTDESALVCVTVRESNGTMVRNEFLTPIPARGQNAFMVAPGTAKEGWFQLSANQPLAGVCFVARYYDPTLMFDIPFVDELSECLYLPHVAQDATWDTTLMICNPGETAAQVTLTFVQSGGTALTPLTVSVPARGSGKYEVTSLTGGTGYDKGSVEISADRGVAAFALYRNTKTPEGDSYAGIAAVKPRP